MSRDLEKRIFDVTKNDFDGLALDIFHYQAEHNRFYKMFIETLGKKVEEVQHIHQIPFLPVSFFKTQQIICDEFLPELYFESSGTTGSVNSKHFIKEIKLYEESFQKGMELFYGDVSEWCILGLLPSYLERGHSSLVYMTDNLIKNSTDTRSGFFMHDHLELQNRLMDVEKDKKKTLLIGVTYALLDFAASFHIQLEHTVVMETGGMKGRKKEITRAEVHETLKKRLGIAEVHSEYGMTEMLSQAYAVQGGKFQTPPWMKVLARSEDDPFEIRSASLHTISGVTNVIDLANLYSCSFLATDDIIRLHPDESFEIYGRLDNSDVRGCSLLSVN